MHTRNNKTMTIGFDVGLLFLLAENNEQLIQDIENFDEAKYCKTIDEFYKELGLVFNGNASEKLAEVIEENFVVGR